MRLKNGVVVMTIAVVLGGAGLRADDPIAAPESVGFSSRGPEGVPASHARAGGRAETRRRDDARGAPRQGGALRRLRQARPRGREAGREGHDLPHRVHDQADRRRGDDDAVGTGQVDARRSGGEAHSRVRRLEGRDAEWRSAANQADDHAAAHEPYRGLRRERRLCQAQHHRSDAAAAGHDRQAGEAAACGAARHRLALRPQSSTSRATSSRSCRARRSTCS